MRKRIILFENEYLYSKWNTDMPETNIYMRDRHIRMP